MESEFLAPLRAHLIVERGGYFRLSVFVGCCLHPVFLVLVQLVFEVFFHLILLA